MSLLVFIFMFIPVMLLVPSVFGFMHHPTSFAQIDLGNLTVRNTMELDINSNNSMADASSRSTDQELPSLQGGSPDAPSRSLDPQHRVQRAQER